MRKWDSMIQTRFKTFMAFFIFIMCIQQKVNLNLLGIEEENNKGFKMTYVDNENRTLKQRYKGQHISKNKL
jgi:hypothetical protein